MQPRNVLSALALVTLFGAASATALTGCTAASGDVGGEELTGADEDNPPRGTESLSGTVTVGASLKTTANLNLRTGPSTSRSILKVIPSGSIVTVVDGTPSSGWYNIKHNGTVGWSSGAYLTLVSSSGGGGGGGSTSSAGRDGAIARAKASVGYSYWWGHGRFSPSGVTSSTAGSCSGSCPSCSHSGSWGGDCSGLAAKVWQVPSSNADMSVDGHPYSTYNFDNEYTSWHNVDRGSVNKADALVYNSSGAGHIFIYESGDGWGSMWAYECKGCSYGCVHNVRTASSSYKAIARNGY